MLPPDMYTSLLPVHVLYVSRFYLPKGCSVLDVFLCQ